MDAKHVWASLRYAKSKAGNSLTYLRKHYPFLFALAVMVGVTLLVLGLITGYGEVFKASYALILERVIDAAFGHEKIAAAKIVGEVAEEL